MNTDANVSDWKRRIVLGTAVGDAHPPAWLDGSYAVFHENVTDDNYPCYFGSDAERRGTLFYSHVSGGDIAHLPETLCTFTALCARANGGRNNLVVFFEPVPAALEHRDYRAKFWETLCHLRDHDPVPPTGAVPPSDPLWEFPFAGLQFFVVGISPSYTRRRSRNLGPGMIMVFQPRQVFTDEATGRDIGTEARRIIRERVKRWDGFEAHPDLDVYGRPGTLEWVQYFVPDDDTRERGRCPFAQAPDADVHPVAAPKRACPPGRG